MNGPVVIITAVAVSAALFLWGFFIWACVASGTWELAVGPALIIGAFGWALVKRGGTK